MPAKIFTRSADEAGHGVAEMEIEAFVSMAPTILCAIFAILSKSVSSYTMSSGRIKAGISARNSM